MPLSLFPPRHRTRVEGQLSITRKLLSHRSRSKAEESEIPAQHSQGSDLSYLNWSVIGGEALPSFTAELIYAPN